METLAFARHPRAYLQRLWMRPGYLAGCGKHPRDIANLGDHDAWAAPTRHSRKRSMMRRADAMLRSGTTCIKLK
jgi:hypothetical protein